MAEDNNSQAKLLAAALYEIRLQLVGRVGKTDDSPETLAGALAYALHNDALAVLEGNSFDEDAAWRRLKGVDERLGTDVSERLRFHIAESEGGG